jgi:glutamate-1-semialdehyde 2,1-aminomutase
MPNRSGLVPAEKEYLDAIQAAARDVGALVIFDEVICFRLAYAGAQSLWDIKPDLTTFGKIIGGGFPVGAVGGRADVMAVFDPTQGKPALPHGGTFSANPVTMRAGLVGMQLLDRAAFQRLDAIGDRVRQGINDAFRTAGIPGCAVGKGSLLKVHFVDRVVRDYRSAYPSADEARRMHAFYESLLANGVLAAGYGLMALSTPMTDADIESVVSAATRAIQAIQ